MLTNKYTNSALKAACLYTDKSPVQCDTNKKLIHNSTVNTVFNNLHYTISESATDTVLTDYLKVPVILGGSFSSGCPLSRFNQVVKDHAHFPVGQYFLPSLTVSRANTVKQFERNLNKLFKDRSVHVKSDSHNSANCSNTFHVHLGSVQTDKKSENLSEQKCTVTVIFDKQTEQIFNIAFESVQGLSPDNQELIRKAFENAQGLINSTQWNNAWKDFNSAFKHRALNTSTYLCETKIALDIADYFISIAVSCGQHVYRADQPQKLLEIDLASEIEKMLDKAKNSQSYKASEVDKIGNVVDTITRLKKSIGIASETLEKKIEQVKSEWQAIQDKENEKIKNAGYVLTSKGQHFLTRKVEDYVILNTENENIQTFQNQVNDMKAQGQNAFIDISSKLINEPVSITECVNLFKSNIEYQNAFTVLNTEHFAIVDNNLFTKLQTYTSENKSPDNTLIHYGFIQKVMVQL